MYMDLLYDVSVHASAKVRRVLTLAFGSRHVCINSVDLELLQVQSSNGVDPDFFSTLLNSDVSFEISIENGTEMMWDSV